MWFFYLSISLKDTFGGDGGSIDLGPTLLSTRRNFVLTKSHQLFWVPLEYNLVLLPRLGYDINTTFVRTIIQYDSSNPSA